MFPIDGIITGGMPAAGLRPTAIPNCVLWLRGDKGITLNDAGITNPNSFDNAAWAKTASSITPDNTTAPDGSVTADSIVEDGTTNLHLAGQVPTNIVSTLGVTQAVYMKAGTRSWGYISNNVTAIAYFNLGTGVIGTVSNGTASMISVGNGWYQCILNTTTNCTQFNIGVTTGDGVTSYAGNGTGNIFLWGASISQPKVSAWADQSGNGNNVTQATAANQPLLMPNAANNKPGLKFNGSSTFLKAAAFTTNNPYTIYIVYNKPTLTAPGANDAIWDGNTAATSFALEDNTPRTLFSSDGGVSSVIYTQAVGNSAYACMGAIVNGTLSALRVNGTQVQTGNGGTGNLTGFTLGALADGTRPTAMTVAEVLIFSRVLSPGELGRLENYLSLRYALGFVAASGPAAEVPQTITGLQAWYTGNLGITINNEAITFPNDFDNGAWAKGQSTITPNSTRDPFGGMLADRLIDTAVNSNHFVNQPVTNRVAGLVETWSVYAKAGTKNWVALGDDTGLHWAFVNLLDGSLGTQLGIVSATTQKILGPDGLWDGWWKISVLSTGYDGNYTIFMCNGNNGNGYLGDGTGYISLYGAAVSQPKVSAWADQSGNGRNLTQATASKQPLLIPNGPNTQNTLQFDATGNQFMVTSAFTLNQPTDIFAVMKVITQGTAGVKDIAWDGIAAGNMVLGSLISNSSSESAGTGLTYASTNLAFPNYKYVECQYNGANSVINENGTALGAAGNAGANNAGGFNLGGLAGGTRGLNAEFAEVIIFNKILSAGERTTINNYLQKKYNL